jgi:hypothetical protein
VFTLLAADYNGRDGTGAGTKILATLAFVGVGAVLALPSAAGAAAPSGVTLHADLGGFRGFVFSPKPGKCADGRLVKLFKEKGKKPNPKRDVVKDKGHAFEQNGKYKWLPSARGYDLHPGRFYARVSAIPGCQADNSKTVHIHARPKTKITGIEERGNGGRNRHRVAIGFKCVGSIPECRYRIKLDHQHWRKHREGEVEYRTSREPSRLRHISSGDHVFKVYAIASTGKRDKTPAELRFHIDHHGHVTT